MRLESFQLDYTPLLLRTKVRCASSVVTLIDRDAEPETVMLNAKNFLASFRRIHFCWSVFAPRCRPAAELPKCLLTLAGIEALFLR